jgi:hypothetical protein
MTEPIPQIGMYRTDAHAYYFNGQGPYANVTGIIDMLDKSDALVGWAKRETASFAIRHLDTLVAHRQHNYPIPECDPCAANLARGRRMVGQQDAARMWVSSIPDYIKDQAADLGTRVHGIAEMLGHDSPIARALDVPAELAPFAAQYRNFMAERRPRYETIEYMGLSRTHGYAGTGDILARLDIVEEDARWLANDPLVAIDIKTHTKDTPLPKTYYPKTGMQLAACSRFDFIGKPDDPTEYPMPKVDAYAVLLLGRDDYRLIPYAVTDATFDAFLACLRLYQWSRGEAQTIVGRVA